MLDTHIMHHVAVRRGATVVHPAPRIKLSNERMSPSRSSYRVNNDDDCHGAASSSSASSCSGGCRGIHVDDDRHHTGSRCSVGSDAGSVR